MLEKLKNLSKREKTGLILAIIALFLTALNYGAVNPFLGYLDKIESEIKIEQQKMKMSKGIIDQEKTAVTRFNEIQNLIAKAPSDEEAIDDMKGQIDELAKKSGVIINAMDHRPVVASGKIGIYMVDIGQFEADIKSLLRFLHEIRTAEGVMRVDKLIFAVEKDKGILKGSVLISKVMLKDTELQGVAPSVQ